ncbi:HSF-type DNA-binding-domain-containing protein [Cristinia sonorae]|uniref:HSF-type DNA-binding-domain-containing protein n=1 Tax=Cristinia sonorae TaxID=1940300 RepID=A0A8K0ULD9_9AGAR|nr:HSF-type DNA-binding-domain-containing protein [Cristinia sonorae]
MDESSHFSSSQRLFQSSQLPPPSQLHLSTSFSRNNVLPPISHIPAAQRYPPPTYSHPSLSNPLPPPSPSHLSWSRTSNSRDDISPPLRHQDSRPRFHDRDSPREPPTPRQPDPPPANVKNEAADDNMPSTSDFVKKLYKMLEDTSFSHVVSWGPQGDCFVVKDMNEFTKTILPRMFKHSNFASFVRQLNKYDFHKVKNTDDNQFGEHSWTFRHPDFHADRRDALENIKRKVPAARKSTGGAAAAAAAAASRANESPTPGVPNATIELMQQQMDRMARTQEEMAAHIRNLEGNYQNVLSEMVNFQRNMAQQDGLMQNLIQYFLQIENGKVKAEELSVNNAQQAGYIPDANPFLPAVEAQRMMGENYPDLTDVARASLAQMNEISRRAELAGMTFTNAGNATTSTPSNNSAAPPRPPSSASRIMAAAAGLLPTNEDGTPIVRPLSRQDALARIEELTRSREENQRDQQPFFMSAPSNNNGSPTGMAGPSSSNAGPSSGPSSDMSHPYGVQLTQDSLAHEGLQVFTVGHLMPRSGMEDDNGNWSFDPNSLNALVMPTPQGAGGDPPQEGESEPQQPLSIAELTSPTPSSRLNRSGGGEPSRPLSAQTLRVRRSTYVPGWAVPPRVLLVDDDAVSRKLSSKFLQVFGCTIDVAVDGVGAVNKMNLEKYDLVLMDIVMPKLDGVSATSLIRQFDHMTPIISMTSNSKPTEILKYYSSGMNDILPKPFSKDGLLDMLEKHLMHLKVIQTMSKVPRGLTSLADTSFDQAMSVPASNNNGGGGLMPLSMGEDDGKINPLAGMGLSDAQYTMILQGLVNGENFMSVGMDGVGMDGMGGVGKRGLDDVSDGRDGKRGRFEVIE